MSTNVLFIQIYQHGKLIRGLCLDTCPRYRESEFTVKQIKAQAINQCFTVIRSNKQEIRGLNPD